MYPFGEHVVLLAPEKYTTGELTIALIDSALPGALRNEQRHGIDVAVKTQCEKIGGDEKSYGHESAAADKGIPERCGCGEVGG